MNSPNFLDPEDLPIERIPRKNRRSKICKKTKGPHKANNTMMVYNFGGRHQKHRCACGKHMFTMYNCMRCKEWKKEWIWWSRICKACKPFV